MGEALGGRAEERHPSATVTFDCLKPTAVCRSIIAKTRTWIGAENIESDDWPNIRRELRKTVAIAREIVVINKRKTRNRTMFISPVVVVVELVVMLVVDGCSSTSSSKRRKRQMRRSSNSCYLLCLLALARHYHCSGSCT